MSREVSNTQCFSVADSATHSLAHSSPYGRLAGRLLVAMWPAFRFAPGGRFAKQKFIEMTNPDNS